MEFFDFENFSIGNPTLSPDNKRLFFVTCAPFPEAMGHTDIYYVDIMDDGTYGNFKYIPGINTSGRESFPFISSEGTLYFSSDGIYDDKPSLGLLDIYKVEDIDQVMKKEKEAKIIHLGSPFNSVMDDFAFFMNVPEDYDECEANAYFSSNRQGGMGEDDIYRVKVKRNIAVKGTIKDKKTGDYIKDAMVELIDSTGMVIKTVRVDSTGIYNFKVECDKNYNIRGSMSRYEDDLRKYNSANAKNNINLELMPFPCEISINHIEFALDSANIRLDAQNALSKLKDILISNPEIKIRIESYTDSRGPAKYNLDLSERRAQNTKLYLINAGVNEIQITSAKGFGEKCLIVSDEELRNLSTVNERNEAHQKNRRSLFILNCKEGFEGCQEADSDD
jgi:outer membrane protein OmpA-like peptidoglycan-associated protein